MTLTKDTKTSLMIIAFSMVFFMFIVYSLIHQNIVGKMFVLGLQGCYMFFMLLMQNFL
jgi:hypothetical protein